MSVAASTAPRAAFVLAFLLLVTSRPTATGLIRPTLVVRAYQVASLAESSWGAALAGTSAILHAAGIAVEWMDCSAVRAGHPESGPERCTMPYDRNEVALRLVDRPTTGRRGQILLGDSMLDGSVHSGTLATIYLDHVDWLAREAHVPIETVMSRTIAHELGHLLLGTNTHSNHGLMRPVWTPAELVRDDAGDWMIPPDESVRMRGALDHRTTQVLSE